MKDSAFRRTSRLLFRLLAYRPPAVPVPPQGIVLEDVTIVNPGQGSLPAQTVAVQGEHIARIGRHAPAGATAAGPYAGSYVLPGLIDMHVHLPPPERELASLLFLAYGVTTVRETGDADGGTWRLRERIRAGRVPGPRIFASGPVLDGDPPFLPTSWAVRDAAAAEDAVATLARMGADLVKVHHKLTRQALAGICQAATRHGLRLAGHIPISVPFEEAGIWDVQHLDGLVPYPQADEGMLDGLRRWCELTPERIAAYVQTSRAQGLVHTPTLVSTESLVWLAQGGPPDDRPVRLLPRYYRDAVWRAEGSLSTYRLGTPESLGLVQGGLQRGMETARALHQAGVRLHTGTDTVGMPFVVPGHSLQRELALLVRAGLSPEEAWIAATRASGESLGLARLGTVREGAPADLLVLGEDPTRDLAALSTLRGVIAQGRFYTQEQLQEALRQHCRRFERPLHDRLVTAAVRLAMKRLQS